MAPSADVAASPAAATTIAGPEPSSKLPTRRKYKASDLPLTPAQRTSIDGLANVIKRKGEFDALRKKVWAEFEDGVSHNPSVQPAKPRETDVLAGRQDQAERSPHSPRRRRD